VVISVALYCIAIGLFFLGLWLYYDRRDHHRFERKRRRRTYHCIRCDHLYQASTDTAAAPTGSTSAAPLAVCPHCGHINAPLRF